jgi:hypothetical protein
LRIEHNSVAGRAAGQSGAAEGCRSQPFRHRQYRK